MLKVTKMIEPMFNRIVVTHKKYSQEEAMTLGGLYTPKDGLVMEYQQVLAVGPNVRGVKVGDMVCIDPSKYLQILHKEGKTSIDKKITADDMRVAAVFPLETIYTKGADGVETSETVMIIYDSDVIYVVPEYEHFNPIIDKGPSIIIPPGGILKTKS